MTAPPSSTGWTTVPPADVAYKLTSLYDPETEAEIAWDDPEVGIEWPLAEPVLSERDRAAPRLAEVAGSLPW